MCWLRSGPIANLLRAMQQRILYWESLNDIHMYLFLLSQSKLFWYSFVERDDRFSKKNERAGLSVTNALHVLSKC